MNACRTCHFKFSRGMNYRQYLIDSCLLHSRQNVKQIMCMSEINNLKWWPLTHCNLDIHEFSLSFCYIQVYGCKKNKTDEKI